MLPDTYYHIYNHANGSENLFREPDNYRYFLTRWSNYINPIADSYAYCLMPNHFHFLVRMKSPEVVLDLQGFENLGGLLRYQRLITQQFSNLFNAYTKAYNKLYNRRGSLFMPNFKKKEITTNEYLTRVIFYIHHNPIHHGFCTSIEAWPHSSFHALVSTKQTQLNRAAVQEWFGSREALKEYHQQTFKGLDKLERELT